MSRSGTDAPAKTAGQYSIKSSYTRGAMLGETNILYRDRCAVLIWQSIEEEKAANLVGGGKAGAKRPRAGGEGGGGAAT